MFNYEYSGVTTKQKHTQGGNEKMRKKQFSTSQVVAMILVTALLSNPVSVFGTVETNLCSLSSVLAPFFGVGKEAVTPTADKFPTASIVEKINYLESENTELKNQMLSLSADNATLSSKVDYLQTTSNALGGGVSNLQQSVDGIVVPDYSSNFTTLAAGISSIDTKAGNLSTSNTNLMAKLTALETKVNALSNSSSGSIPAGKFNIINYVLTGGNSYASGLYSAGYPTVSPTCFKNSDGYYEVQATCTVPIYNNWDIVTSNKGLYIDHLGVSLYVSYRVGNFDARMDQHGCKIEGVYLPVNKTVKVHAIDANGNFEWGRNCYLILKNTGANLIVTQCFVTNYTTAQTGLTLNTPNIIPEGAGVRGSGYYF